MWLEDRFVFRPVKAAVGWNPTPDPDIRDVEFTSSDGTRLHAWWLDRGVKNGAVLFCHGNGGNISARGRTMLRFSEFLGRAVFLFDYPGYGKSEGRPSEEGCYRSAIAAYEWLTGPGGARPDGVVLYGESLGAAVAVELSLRVEHRSLVLMKPFSSLADAAAVAYPWFPGRRLLKNRFDSFSKIGKCPRPVLIASGTRDRVTPFAQGRRLYERASEPKRFVTLEGAEHNAFVPDEFLTDLKPFLDHPPA